MSISVQKRGNKHQLRVKHRLLAKPFFFTFDTEQEATAYGGQLHGLLDRGIVPAELVEQQAKAHNPLLLEVIRDYTKLAPITASDDALLNVIVGEVSGVRVGALTYQWVEDYVRARKVTDNLSPGTVRKRVGALARVLDWHLLRSAPPGQVPSSNAFRLLPRGYSLYTRGEAAELAEKKKLPKVDQVRDRRLSPAEDQRVLLALAGERREGRERPLSCDAEFTMLYHLIVSTGMRLREAYRQRIDGLDITRRVINVEGSKGHRGVIKPRTVPMVQSLADQLASFVGDRRGGLLFNFWNGTPEDLDRTSWRLSHRFTTLFDYAQVPDFTEHDLRHEATCRWVLMRSPLGGWMFGDIEICRIMGWRDVNMMLRYASLRGEDLSARLGGQSQG